MSTAKEQKLTAPIDRNGVLAKLLVKTSVAVSPTKSVPQLTSNPHLALVQIKELVKKGCWGIDTYHGMKRAKERNVTTLDIREALLTARQCIWQPDHQTWKVSGGHDQSGDPLAIAIAKELSAKVTIITVFEG